MKNSFPLCLLLAFFCLNLSQSQSNTSSNKVETQQMNPERSIVENTDDSCDHNMLSTAIKASELEDLLHTEGPFTVFAPSDIAFENLPEDKVNSLLKKENKKDLKSLLAYHIVAGDFSASKILLAMCRGNGTASFTTVQGNKLIASMRGTDIYLTDSLGNSAKITTADAKQKNGVIHVIDSVIMPSRM